MVPGHTGGYLVLQVEDVFQQAVEAVGPQMRPGFRLDQSRADAHPTAALPDRAFEHIAHAQFPADAVHIDRLALVREARIAGDDGSGCG